MRDRLGWALAPERGANGAGQSFQHGHMLRFPDPKQIFVLSAQETNRAPTTWRLYTDLFVG